MLKLNFTIPNTFSFKAQKRQTAFATMPLRALKMDEFILRNKSSNGNKLSIYYYNDTHGNTDSMADVINNAKRFQENSKDSKDTTFILSAGDNCSGADAKKNGLIFDIMQNIMGVELSAVGNHEVDATGAGFFDAAKGKKTTFVATNVTFDDDNKMKDIVKKSAIKEKNGVKYGFIGTMPIDFKMCSKEASQKGVNVMDMEHTIIALQNEINNLKSQGVDRIIMLSHVGYDTDKEIVSNLDGVDIVIGGHSHSIVDGAKQNENVLKSKTGEPVIITQGGENGLYYGILNVEFNDKGVLTKIHNNLISTKNKSKNPIIEYVKTQKLGISPHVGTIKQSEPLPKNRRIEPSGWTEMMADSMRIELDSDIALINSANIRKVPKEGNLTERDVMESAPMKNQLLKVKITQKQLVEAIKNAAKNTMSAEDGYPGLIQGSGFTYKIEDTGELIELKVLDKNGNYIPVDINNPSEDITYVAVYDSFMAKKDGETPELAPKFEVQEFDFDKDYTMCQYLSKSKDKESIVVKRDNRIEIIKTSKEKQKGNSTRNI